MRLRTLALASAGFLLTGGALWYSSLDAETRGVLRAFPTDRDVLSWSQSQREAAFRPIWVGAMGE